MNRRLRSMPCRSATTMIRRWSTVLLTITAWILLSNHCVLALSGTGVSSRSETGGCPMHSSPAKEKPLANIPCCKDLRAVTAHATKSVAAVARQLVGGQDYVAAFFVVPRRVALLPVPLDTGPPHSLSFAESILQRSILVHAPPARFPRL